MPSKQRKLCNEPGCSKFATKGTKCDDHYRQPQRGDSQAYRHWYSDTRWRTLRQHWLNSHPLCEECKKNGKLTQATIVDHIDPHKGSWSAFMDTGNLQSLCKQHHDAKTAREDGGFGNKKG